MGKESDRLEWAKYMRKPYILVSEITKSDGRSKKLLLYLFQRCAYE